MRRIRKFWLGLGSSLWVLPSLCVLAAILLAWVLTVLDAMYASRLREEWPALFGISGEGARSILAEISSSMVTVAGVTFSITIVALALAANQYSPRVLRNFMKDRGNQAVLGIFVGVFTYSLIVLRTVRGGDEPFIPALSVLVAIALAIVAVGFFIYFIHHIAISIQVSHIIATVAAETSAVLEPLFEPQEEAAQSGDMEDEAWSRERIIAHGRPTEQEGWSEIRAAETGYIQNINAAALTAFLRQRNARLCLEKSVGEFVVKGGPLGWVRLPGGADSRVENKVNSLVVSNYYRTLEQDPVFGLRQIVDIALKALSPSLNDTTTAVTCVDYLGGILCRVAAHRPRAGGEDAPVELVVRDLTFERLLDEAMHDIRRNAAGNVAVILAIVEALKRITHYCLDARQRHVVSAHARLVRELAGRSVPSRYDLMLINRRLSELDTLLLAGGQVRERPGCTDSGAG